MGKYGRYIKAVGTQPTPGERVHLAGVFDHEQVAFYQNGKLQQAVPFPGPFRKSPLPLMVGASPEIGGGSAFYFAGIIEQVRVTRAVRYTDAFMPALVLLKEPDTLLLYQFTEREGTFARDASGNGHHGVIEGARWVRLDPP